LLVAIATKRDDHGARMNVRISMCDKTNSSVHQRSIPRIPPGIAEWDQPSVKF